MKRKVKITAWIAVGILTATYLINASWLAPVPDGKPIVIAHRGVHQTFSKEGLGKEDCTATGIYPLAHQFIENTLPSIARSIELGADVVEIDVQPTADGEIVVFHDHRLECRTNGVGVVRQQNLAYLKSLDIGFGYTHDSGASYPLRGTGVGMMPSLAEVYRQFPKTQFILDIKHGDARAGVELVAYLKRENLLSNIKLIATSGGSDRPVAKIRELVPDALVASGKSVKACAVQYLSFGWTGAIPAACRNTGILVPVDKTTLLWGWPNRFLQRMASANTLVILLGESSSSGHKQGFYHTEQLQALPAGFNGGIWVERIETLGPAIAKTDKQK